MEEPRRIPDEWSHGATEDSIIGIFERIFDLKTKIDDKELEMDDKGLEKVDKNERDI